MPDRWKEYTKMVRAAHAQYGDPQQAAKYLRVELGKHPALFGSIRERLIMSGILESVYNVRGMAKEAIKSAVWTITEAIAHDRKPVLSAMAKTRIRSILEIWTLPNGRALGDVRGTDLKQWEEQELKQSKGHLLNGNFYRVLRQKAGNSVIRRKLTSNDAINAWKKVSGSTKIPESVTLRMAA